MEKRKDQKWAKLAWAKLTRGKRGGTKSGLNWPGLNWPGVREEGPKVGRIDLGLIGTVPNWPAPILDYIHIHCVLLQYTVPLQCLEKSVRSMGIGTEGARRPSPPIIQLGWLAPSNNGTLWSEKKIWKSNWNDLSNMYVAVTFYKNKQFWIKNVCLAFGEFVLMFSGS